MDYELLFTKWGVPDFGRSGGTVTWSMSLAGLQFDAAANPGLTLDQFEEAMQAAFDIWEIVSDIDFVYVPSSSNVDIYVDMATLSGPTVGLASWFERPGDGDGDGVRRFDDATIEFDIGETWAPYGEGGDLNFYAVAAHEVGHLMGLDHVNTPRELMYAFVGPEDVSDGDVAGAIAIYGAKRYGTDGSDMINLSWVPVGLTINAEGGDDDARGTGANDVMFGGMGNDTVAGLGGDDLIVDGFGNNRLEGGADDDRLVGGFGVTDGYGGGGADILIGGSLGDTLDGGTGRDVLVGDPQDSLFFGEDLLIAGRGEDFLEGGGGADTFVFEPTNGENTIGQIDINFASPFESVVVGADFSSGVDVIALRGFGYATQQDALDQVSMVNGVAVFSDQDTTIIFAGLTVNDLSAEDFVLWI